MGCTIPSPVTTPSSWGRLSWKFTWKMRAPPTVKFFIWFACQDHWTTEQLARCGLLRASCCLLCNQEETMGCFLLHYVARGPFLEPFDLPTARCWRSLCGLVATCCFPGTHCHAQRHLFRRSCSMCDEFGSIITALVFDNVQLSVANLLDTIEAEAMLATAGTVGLTVLLSAVYDTCF